MSGEKMRRRDGFLEDFQNMEGACGCLKEMEGEDGQDPLAIHTRTHTRVMQGGGLSYEHEGGEDGPMGTGQIDGQTHCRAAHFLPPPPPPAEGGEGQLPLRTLILDLDETLVHTEFDVRRPLRHADNGPLGPVSASWNSISKRRKSKRWKSKTRNSVSKRLNYISK